MPRRHRITALKFTPHTVSFRMDGEPVWDRVEISPRVPMVGHFSLNRPVVRVLIPQTVYTLSVIHTPHGNEGETPG